jgi:hypothetical protein
VTHLMIMADVIGNTKALGNQLNLLLLTTVMGLISSFVVVGIYVTTRSAVKAFVAAIGAAALWFVVANMGWFRDQIGQDIQHPSGAIVITTQRVDEIR